MNQLSASKRRKLLSALKKYRRRFLVKKNNELDESATRILINSFLTEVLGYKSIDEVTTEYMIRGAYADYLVQLKGKAYFVVEVKAMTKELSQKHLRQVMHYAADEGIEWALLTNGRCFELYKVIFEKPIDSRKVFSVDLLDEEQVKNGVECFQFITKALIQKKGMDHLWQRSSALDPSNISRFLYDKPVVNYLKRQLKKYFKTKVDEDDLYLAIKKVIEEPMESGKPFRSRKHRRNHRRSEGQELNVDAQQAIPTAV